MTLFQSLALILTDANLVITWSRNPTRSDRSVTQWKPAARHQHYWNE